MLVEHPEICPGCCQWVDVVNSQIVAHERPGEPRNASERRRWKKRGRPRCSGSGSRIPHPPCWIER